MNYLWYKGAVSAPAACSGQGSAGRNGLFNPLAPGCVTNPRIFRLAWKRGALLGVFLAFLPSSGGAVRSYSRMRSGCCSQQAPTYLVVVFLLFFFFYWFCFSFLI